MGIRQFVSGKLGAHIAEGQWDEVWKKCDEMGRIKSNIQPILLELCKRVEQMEKDEEILPQKHS